MLYLSNHSPLKYKVLKASLYHIELLTAKSSPLLVIMVIAFCNLVRAMLASLALLPAPTVAQSGDLNSLSRVLSRFEHLSVFANLLKV